MRCLIHLAFRPGLLLPALALLIVLVPLQVRESGAGEAARHVQAQYESVKSFTADFTQRLTNAASGETGTRSGTISFRQPRLIRWETKRGDDPELLVVGKDTVWDYYPEEKVAYSYPAEDILGSKTMLRFLSGTADLEEDFLVEEAAENGLVRIQLVPRRPEPSLVEASLWVAPGMWLLSRVRLVDFYGNVNDLELKNVVLNPDLPDALFAFKPPAGVEVQKNAPTP